jgi:hypothetical protein
MSEYKVTIDGLWAYNYVSQTKQSISYKQL